MRKSDKMSSFSEFETSIYKMLDAIPNEDATRPGLKDTPERVAKFFLNEAIHGYVQNVNSVIANSVYESPSDDLIIVKNINFYSLCEHHFVPFFGTASIGYYAKDNKVLDTAKMGRVVDIYAKRLQNQENLTNNIADALFYGKLDPKGVGVYVEAEHLCMAMRGARKQNSTAVTITTRGNLQKDQVLKNQWLSLAK
jgi:GTP cyclohydrolase I